MDPAARLAMASAARDRAEREFGIERMIAGYEAALKAAIVHRTGMHAG
jgi:hypothetical protein